MASQVIAYVAVSIDGYIAGDGGSVDFLERFGTDEYRFHEFIETVDAVVMGSDTYEQILDFGWPYGDTPGLVLTTRRLGTAPGAAITFTETSTGAAIRSFARGFENRIWVVGGGKVITDGLLQGAIDVLEMYIMPVALGTGIALFASEYAGPLDLTDTERFNNGVVKLVYSTTQ